jgi:5-formyltetrahydrofolate cyclo-ligase
VEIVAEHGRAVAEGRPTYRDPDTGLDVMTAATLWEREWCCDQGCRHCPYVGTTDKRAWRRWARQVWASLDRATTSAAVVAALQSVVAAAADRGRVLAYRALDHEIDLDPLIVDIRSDRFALARLPGDDGELTLHPADSALERHRFGVLQPRAGSPAVEPGELSLVLVPGLVFDRRGTRIGHGLGHFDRLLAGVTGRADLVGVASDAVVVPDLPCEGHDVAMDALATGSGLHPTTGAAGQRDQAPLRR